MEGLNHFKAAYGYFPGGSVVDFVFQCWGCRLHPGQGAEILHTLQSKNQNIKQNKYCNKFNKDFKNGPHEKKILEKK